MTLYAGQPCSYGFQYSNLSANPSTTPGTAITPGYSNAEGSWTQIASSANIAYDCQWLYLHLYSSNVAGVGLGMLLDIGIDPAGGTSYTAFINNLAVGGQAGTTACTCSFIFPIVIPAGASVALRAQSSHTTGTIRAMVTFYGQPSRPEAMPLGHISQTFGTITNSDGPTITPGNAGDGTWVDLGATTYPLWWWQAGLQINNATVTSIHYYLELGWGDGSTKHIFHKSQYVTGTSESVGRIMNNSVAWPDCVCPVPAGYNIYARMRCAGAPDTGFNLTVVGIGG